MSTMEELRSSLTQYKNQLKMVSEALPTVGSDEERESLLTLQSDLNQLIQLTEESLNTLEVKEKICEGTTSRSNEQSEKPVIDDEYALFMEEMARSGAYESNSCQEQLDCSKTEGQYREDSDIEEELSSLLGMKCAVYHTHKWGGQPTLYNAMVSAVVPRQDDDQYNDLKVKVLYTHPTHAEMLPCPYYLDGECKFDDEQCRYSHGAIIKLSDLKDSIDPDFDSIKTGSRILLKIKPTDDEDVSITKKSTEKYHLWHRAIVRSVDLEKRICVAKLEHGVKAGQKRKLGADECQYSFEEIFPLNTECLDTSSDDDVSDTEYPENKTLKETDNRELLVEKSAPSNAPAMGAWERHTRGMGSRMMLAMGYVPGTGLGAASDGRLRPVEARALPVGKSLDHCMTISEAAARRDPLLVEQKLRKLQKREEDRNKRAYEREKEREKRNVFNFLNKTLGNQPEGSDSLNAASSVDIKQSTSRDLNIEQFKITEDVKRVERELAKLNSSLSRCPAGSSGHKNLTMQITEKNKQLEVLKRKENQISKEQSQRKNKEKMTVF